jgi:hypothetical protein
MSNQQQKPKTTTPTSISLQQLIPTLETKYQKILSKKFNPEKLSQLSLNAILLARLIIIQRAFSFIDPKSSDLKPSPPLDKEYYIYRREIKGYVNREHNLTYSGRFKNSITPVQKTKTQYQLIIQKFRNLLIRKYILIKFKQKKSPDPLAYHPLELQKIKDYIQKQLKNL